MGRDSGVVAIRGGERRSAYWRYERCRIYIGGNDVQEGEIGTWKRCKWSERDARGRAWRCKETGKGMFIWEY